MSPAIHFIITAFMSNVKPLGLETEHQTPYKTLISSTLSLHLPKVELLLISKGVIISNLLLSCTHYLWSRQDALVSCYGYKLNTRP